MDVADNPIEIQPANYRDAIIASQECYIQFAVYDKDVELHLLKMLRGFLSRHDLLYLRDVIVTIIKELITNAVKANAKRLYFKIKGLHIDNADDYQLGMITFRKDVLHHDSQVFQEISRTNLRVRVLFIADNDILSIRIINNIPIVPEELAKINLRLQKAFEYNDITEAFTDTLDDTEGAGLGLVMAMMVFKNSGFAQSDLVITSDNGKTISSTILNKRHSRQGVEHIIADEILKEVETIPSFPDNVRQIEAMCGDNNRSISEIANCIKRDPGLSSSILKLANSAGYVTVRRIETIEDAVKIIGIKGIKTLVLASGVQNIIESKYKRYKELWTDSCKKAYYAQKIAIQLKNHHLSEPAYLGALLSEIGKIILLTVNTEAMEKIVRIAGIKEIGNMDIFEEMALGISHATLGAVIAKKWQFSESLIKSIEFYLRPYIAPEEYKELIYIIHLSHAFTEIEKKRYRFELIDDDVLQFFHLSNKETFDKLHSILKQAYQQKASA